MYINLVLYYYHVHWYSTVLLARRWFKYCIFVMYIKSRRRLRRSGRDAHTTPPPSLLFSSSRKYRMQRRRRWCRGILLAAAATSVAAVTNGIVPPSSAAASSVVVDAFLPPPFLLSRSAAGGAAARLLRPILDLGRPCLSPPLALYRVSSSEEGGFRIPPPLFPPPEPESDPASMLLSQPGDWINMLN